MPVCFYFCNNCQVKFSRVTTYDRDGISCPYCHLNDTKLLHASDLLEVK